MNDSEFFEWLNELRADYEPPTIPDCRVCGATLVCGSVGKGQAKYHCPKAAEEYMKARIGTEEYEAADEHWMRSRVLITSFGDTRVLHVIELFRQALQDREYLFALCAQYALAVKGGTLANMPKARSASNAICEAVKKMQPLDLSPEEQ